MDLELITNWAQILALPVAIIAIIVSIVLYRRTRQHRALSCTFESPEHPVEIKTGAGLAGDIEILYRGEKVNNLYIARATIRNTGNVQILASDFVEPLTFTFEPGVRLVGEPRTTDAQPANLTTDWSVETGPSASESTIVQVDLPLLNPGDHFTAELLYTGDDVLPTVSAHIAGVPAIDLWDPYKAEEARKRSERVALLARLPAYAGFITIFLFLIGVLPELLAQALSASALFLLLAVLVAGDAWVRRKP